MLVLRNYELMIHAAYASDDHSAIQKHDDTMYSSMRRYATRWFLIPRDVNYRVPTIHCCGNERENVSAFIFQFWRVLQIDILMRVIHRIISQKRYLRNRIRLIENFNQDIIPPYNFCNFLARILSWLRATFELYIATTQYNMIRIKCSNYDNYKSAYFSRTLFVTLSKLRFAI